MISDHFLYKNKIGEREIKNVEVFYLMSNLIYSILL